MIWSDEAIDYDEGFTKAPDGRLVPNKIGCYVRTIEESRRVLDERNNIHE